MNVKNQSKYVKATRLKANGFKNKEIAKKIGISEQTLSKWLKESPIIRAQNIQKKLLIRLEKEAETLTPDEIVRLSDSITKLGKIAFSTD